MGFVYPSSEEGFGLPVVEAFYCNCPVVTSNRSCLPEVAGDAALFVEPTDPVALEAAMTDLAQRAELRQILREKGRKRAELYDWSSPADRWRRSCAVSSTMSLSAQKPLVKRDRPNPINRVLQVVEPGVDGVFRHVEGLVDYLHARDVSVDLAFSSRRGSDRLTRLVERVRERGGEALDLQVGNAPEPGDLAAVLSLVRAIRRRKPSVIHAHSSKAGALVRMLPRPLLAERTFTRLTPTSG